MKRRPFFKKLILGTGFMVAAGKTKANSMFVEASPIGFNHVVFFWLRKDLDDKQKTFFLEQLTGFLKQVNEINTWQVGQPANTPREVVDNSYSYSLFVSFKDAAAHDAYQKHPAHLVFIDKCRDLWDRVQVYDSVSL